MSLHQKLIKIREAKWFSNLTTSIIIFYAAVLGLKTIDEVEGIFGTAIMALDYFVTIYFLVEIIIKMSAAENLKEFFSDRWNVFDFIIVAITLIPLEDTALAPIARLLRVFRVLRLLTSRPELKDIIDMLIGAIPAIIDIALLMFIIFYIFPFKLFMISIKSVLLMFYKMNICKTAIIININKKHFSFQFIQKPKWRIHRKSIYIF